MSNERGGAKWGALIQTYRQKAEMTQEDLATASKVRRNYIASIEFGRIGVPSPDIFNKLHRVLRFPGWEVLEAIGYETDAGMDDIAPALLTVARALPERQQVLLAEMGKTWIRGDSITNGAA